MHSEGGTAVTTIERLGRIVDRPGLGIAALLQTCSHPPVLMRCRPGELNGVLDDLAALACGAVVIALDGDHPLATPDAHDPLVFRTTVDGEGRGPLAGLALRLADAVPVTVPGVVLATVGDHAIAVERRGGDRRVVVLGSAELLGDAWLPVASNATLVAYALGARTACDAVALVRRQRPSTGAATHPMPLEVRACDDNAALLDLVPDADVAVDSSEFMRLAAHAGRALPAAVHDALVDFADHGHPSGAMVVRGLPVGVVPPTPVSPHASTRKDRTSELVLLAAGRRLGQPVGYAPEHSGQVVQNLVPTRAAAGAQTSTSSAVMLDFHTEAAFHPHAPRFLLLLCVRADPSGEARTLLCSIDAVVDQLSLGARAVLAQPRFRTCVDESFTNGRTSRLGRLVPVLSGDPARPRLTFDADLMCGADAEAVAALDELRALVHANHVGVALEAGDLLVVDNHAAVHGRSPYPARYDGTDRWLQRSFVVSDLSTSAGERNGRVITTRFAP